MQARALDTRGKLLDATAEVIDSTGYDGASLNEILRLAGVTKGALYHHFASKAAMARALVDDQFAPELSTPQIDNRPILHAAEVAMSAARSLTTDRQFRAAFGIVIDRPHADLGDLSEPIGQWNGIIAELIDADPNRTDTVDSRIEAKMAVTYFVGAYTLARIGGDFGTMIPSLADYWQGAAHRMVLPAFQGDYRSGIGAIFSRP